MERTDTYSEFIGHEIEEEESNNELKCDCGEEMPASEAWIFTDWDQNNKESIICSPCRGELLKQGYSVDDFKPYENII